MDKTVFIYVTATALEKSVLDAIEPVRHLFVDANYHNYAIQGQGAEHKVKYPCQILTDSGPVMSTVSLYRPMTKKGDPRLWISRLGRFVKPNTTIGLEVKDGELVVHIG